MLLKGPFPCGLALSQESIAVSTAMGTAGTWNELETGMRTVGVNAKAAKGSFSGFIIPNQCHGGRGKLVRALSKRQEEFSSELFPSPTSCSRCPPGCHGLGNGWIMGAQLLTRKVAPAPCMRLSLPFPHGHCPPGLRAILLQGKSSHRAGHGAPCLRSSLQGRVRACCPAGLCFPASFPPAPHKREGGT